MISQWSARRLMITCLAAILVEAGVLRVVHATLSTELERAQRQVTAFVTAPEVPRRPSLQGPAVVAIAPTASHVGWDSDFVPTLARRVQLRLASGILAVLVVPLAMVGLIGRWLWRQRQTRAATTDLPPV